MHTTMCAYRVIIHESSQINDYRLQILYISIKLFPIIITWLIIIIIT